MIIIDRLVGAEEHSLVRARSAIEYRHFSLKTKKRMQREMMMMMMMIYCSCCPCFYSRFCLLQAE